MTISSISESFHPVSAIFQPTAEAENEMKKYQIQAPVRCTVSEQRTYSVCICFGKAVKQVRDLSAFVRGLDVPVDELRS